MIQRYEPIMDYSVNTQAEGMAWSRAMCVKRDNGEWVKYTDHLSSVESLERRVALLESCLKPFANYACDEPCECPNCKARAALGEGK
jgi:hypothetical protein